MSDNISRRATLEAIQRHFNPTGEEMPTEVAAVLVGVGVVISTQPSTDRKGHWMSFEQVADMLSGMFGNCACDVNGNDEWLPSACKYADTECPHPKEENGCWMQFLQQGGADMRGVDDESTL